jgi:hypothetical protein
MLAEVRGDKVDMAGDSGIQRFGHFTRASIVCGSFLYAECSELSIILDASNSRNA